MAAAVAAEPQGFVIEAVSATPEADTPIDRNTRIDIEDTGYILIIMRNGQIIRKDGPFHEPAADLFDRFNRQNDDDVGNGILPSLLELAEVSGRSTEQLGGVRGAERSNEVHLNAITAATKTYCMVAGEAPGFYASTPPRRDEPLILRLRASPKSFFQATWPVSVTDLPWPAHWSLPKEGRYIWSLGSQGSAPLWFRLVDALPDDLVKRAALYNDMRCYTQAIALIRKILASAERL
ncbi:MAG: hypothetical protein VCD66_02955 [Alphaproteobacteria bacterium]